MAVEISGTSATVASSLAARWARGGLEPRPETSSNQALDVWFRRPAMNESRLTACSSSSANGEEVKHDALFSDQEGRSLVGQDRTRSRPGDREAPPEVALGFNTKREAEQAASRLAFQVRPRRARRADASNRRCLHGRLAEGRPSRRCARRRSSRTSGTCATR